MGLKCALSAKANEGRLILVDSLLPETPKTKFMAGKLENLLQIQAAAAGSLVAGSAAAGDQQGLSELLLDLQHVQETQLGQAAGVREAGQLKRVNAVLIDSSKEGEDGGKLMRRAVSNLPGASRGGKAGQLSGGQAANGVLMDYGVILLVVV